MAAIIFRQLRTVLSRPAVFSRRAVPDVRSLLLSRPHLRFYSQGGGAFKSRASRQPLGQQQNRFPTKGLYIGNLPWDMSEDEVREQLGACGFPRSVEMEFGYDLHGRFKGAAYAYFDNAGEAKEVLEGIKSTEVLIGDRRPIFDYTSRQQGGQKKSEPTSTIFVGNLPFHARDSDLVELFGQFGKILRANISYDNFGESRGFAHVELSSVDEAKALFNAQPFTLLDRSLRLDYAKNRKDDELAPTKRLYFRNFQGDELELRMALKDSAARISGIHFLKNSRTLEPTRSGFINFNTTEHATHALETHRDTTSPEGHRLELSYARMHEPHTSS